MKELKGFLDEVCGGRRRHSHDVSPPAPFRETPNHSWWEDPGLHATTKGPLLTTAVLLAAACQRDERKRQPAHCQQQNVVQAILDWCRILVILKSLYSAATE